MKIARQSKTRLFSGWQNGLTLIEVVVGMAIAGTLLVTTIMAASSHRVQVRRAEQKKLAVEAIDQLLSAWAADGFDRRSLARAIEVIGVPGGGFVPEGKLGDAIRLRIDPQPKSVIRDLSLEIIRVEAYVGMETAKPISWIEVARSRRAGLP